MNVMAVPLPPQFAHLGDFSHWALPTTAARVAKRLGSTKAELNDFYAGMLPSMDEILTYLNRKQLGEMSAQDKSLYYMALALADIGIYVEWFDGLPAPPSARAYAAVIKVVGEPTD